MDYLLNCENSSIAIELFNEFKEAGIDVRVVPTPSIILDGCGLSLIVMCDKVLKTIDKRSNKFVAYQIEYENGKKLYKKLLNWN